MHAAQLRTSAAPFYPRRESIPTGALAASKQPPQLPRALGGLFGAVDVLRVLAFSSPCHPPTHLLPSPRRRAAPRPRRSPHCRSRGTRAARAPAGASRAPACVAAAQQTRTRRCRTSRSTRGTGTAGEAANRCTRLPCRRTPAAERAAAMLRGAPEGVCVRACVCARRYSLKNFMNTTTTHEGVALQALSEQLDPGLTVQHSELQGRLSRGRLRRPRRGALSCSSARCTGREGQPSWLSRSASKDGRSHVHVSGVEQRAYW